MTGETDGESPPLLTPRPGDGPAAWSPLPGPDLDRDEAAAGLIPSTLALYRNVTPSRAHAWTSLKYVEESAEYGGGGPL